MKKFFVLFASLMIFCFSTACAGEIGFYPVEHASFVIDTGEVIIYVDPVGDKELYSGLGKPDIILITDIHGDHLSKELLDEITGKAMVVGPKAVIDEIGSGKIMKNGETKEYKGVNIEAVPMYNLTEERAKFHPRGRGNGYVLTVDKERIYISGDTEDIPEMRALKGIDHAFVCMNLPYTMTVKQAVSAVVEFEPVKAYPYHYRGKPGFSDIEKFKKQVEKRSKTEVVLLEWYR